MRDRLAINKENLPYRAQFVLGAGVYTLEVHYNSRMDAFTVHLYKGEDLVCGGERLVYARPLWQDVYEAGQYPPLRLVPLDESGAETEIRWENLGKTVFLTLEDD